MSDVKQNKVKRGLSPEDLGQVSKHHNLLLTYKQRQQQATPQTAADDILGNRSARTENVSGLDVSGG
ncbi:hypothetical protein EYF80_056402 [Liparis tanakae]|uniref:Uncharacterized protein n=1 Tax=Liparis tanakae TaxID=230148 RepID=A0A4Z2EYY0_9TELE|nr:hypothetical protein EYF80_056402 [Liparis tanakae]